MLGNLVSAAFEQNGLVGDIGQRAYPIVSYAAPKIPTDVPPHFSSMTAPDDVAKNRGVIVYRDGRVKDIELQDRGWKESELVSDYNRRRYIQEALKTAELFDTDEIRRFDEHLSQGKTLSPIRAVIAVSEKGVGKRIAATYVSGIPVWHTDFYRRVAKETKGWREKHPEIEYEDALGNTVHHERRHMAVDALDLWYFLTGNEVGLEGRLEKDLYNYFMKAAEEAETQRERQHYLNMAKISEERLPGTRRRYTRKNEEDPDPEPDENEPGDAPEEGEGEAAE